MPKPLIGRVQGQAFGGGVGLISVCDVAVGVETAKLGLTEVRLGLIPATIGPYVIARMGAARARAVFFSGRVFGAEEAVALGLLARVVQAEELDAAVRRRSRPTSRPRRGRSRRASGWWPSSRRRWTRRRWRAPSRRWWAAGRIPKARRASRRSSRSVKPSWRE
jgi:enoyl-CoA hydratase/carnithine racemase